MLSVIIPVYNVEKTLEKCIYSVLDNDLEKDKFEIIIVDDESPDSSLTIAKNAAEGHDNIKIISQKNKGLGGARNTGIDNATGKYLMFLDSDDYLSKGTLKELMSIAAANEPEILEFAAASVDTSGKVHSTIVIDANGVFDGISYWQKYPSINSACNKLYNSKFLKAHNLKFKEKIFAEDFEFNTRALYYAKKVMATTHHVSNFVRSENSITRNKNIESKKKYINDFITILGFIDEFKDKVNDQKFFFGQRLTMLNIDLFLFMAKNGFTLAERKAVKVDLQKKKLFHTEYPIKGFRKNVIRIIFRYLRFI